MSSNVKKPILPSSAGGRRPSTDPSVNSNTTPRRSPTPSSSSSPSTNGAIARTRSLRGGTPVSARAAMQRSGPGGSNLSTNSNATSEVEDDSRAEAIALVDELKERLRTTEVKSNHFQKETEVLQSRLDEALVEQGKLEDRLHEAEERLEILDNEKRESGRQMREMESIYEAERVAMTREKDDMANREEEMQAVIQRLKDSLSQRSVMDEEIRISRHSNNSSPSFEGGHFAPSAALHRSDSRNNSKFILQKDRLIESLRLELAEAQIKLVETENMGGGRLQEVERLLLEARMTNARLMEDNESFQLLLQEKTLNGDFSKNEFGYMSSAANADALNALEGRTVTSSLADELSVAAEGESENYRRLEAELKAAKDQNKALTLYINKIIERLLQHQDFEAILDQSSDFKPGANVDKDLPPPPPPKETATGTSLLQRAKSVAMGAGKARPRPISQMPAAHSALTDPDTAPSIPFGLGRSTSVRQGRPQSEQFTRGAASVVNQMYKGPAPQVSPPIGGPQTSQSSFGPPAIGGNPNAGSRYASAGQFPIMATWPSAPNPGAGQVPTTATFPGGKTSENSSRASVESGDLSTPPSTSPPRPEKATTFAGNKPRPLRLVQDHNEGVVEDRKNKRASWMGWAQGIVAGKKDEISTEVIKE